MIAYNDILNFVRGSGIDSHDAAVAVLRQMAGKVDEDAIKAAFLTEVVSDMKEYSSNDAKEILDEYCEVYGFENLVDELRYRREEEYEEGL